MSQKVTRHAWPRAGRGILAGALLGLAACAGRPTPPAQTVRQQPAAPPARLAWLPVDALDAPDLARTLNDHLARVRVPGTTGRMKAAVSMEVAQLAIECTAPTPACYAAVGRSLGADQMLWAELGTTEPRGKSVRVVLTLFDVRGGASAKRVEKTFEGRQAARDGVAELVERTFAGGTPPP
jgi:hypothetical protein